MRVVRGEYASGLGYDFIKPEREGAPLLFFIHGGGWMGGDRSMFAEEAAWFAEQGYATALISYRFSPAHTFPDQVLDVRNFVRHVVRESSSLGFDPAKVVAFGNSSDGHLALMLACADDSLPGDELPPPGVRGCVSLAGISDLTDESKSYPEISEQFVPLFMGGNYHGNEERYAAASPIKYLERQKPEAAFLLIHGDQDEIVPVSQSRTMADALKGAGAEVVYEELPGEHHAYSMSGMNRIRQLTLQFMQRLFPS
ncbi:MAG: alpha/beta hydrolase fold domain-containing protein [Fimbriimonadaceae bacterium]